MPIQYIGRKTNTEGKRLFDILCRLKNFGVGRVVVRSHYLRVYPEPTYYVITKVEPDMSDPTQADPDCKVNSQVHVKTVFRGENRGVLSTLSCYKADWKLIPRDEEHKYLNSVKKPPPKTVVPDTVPFPPLIKHFIMLERKRRGEPLDEPPMLPIKSVLVPKPTVLPPD